MPWRRERLPTPIFWPGEFHGLYCPWGLKESDTTEQLSLLVVNENLIELIFPKLTEYHQEYSYSWQSAREVFSQFKYLPKEPNYQNFTM